jgi:hypothetical protein
MHETAGTKFDPRLAFFLFGYGGLVHLLMFRALAWPSESSAPILTGVGIFALGGTVLLALFYRPSRRVWALSRDFLTRLALLGVLASFIVIEVYLVVLAVGAIAPGWRDLRMLSFGTQLGMFGVMLLSVHTYSLSLFVYLLPVGSVQGVVAGILISRFKLTVPAESTR